VISSEASINEERSETIPLAERYIKTAKGVGP